MKRHVLSLMLSLLLTGAVGAEVVEHWYVMQMMGQPMGWMMMRQETREGKIVSTWLNNLSIARGGQEMKIELGSSFTESIDGTPLSATSQMKMAMIEQSSQWAFDGKSIEMTHTSAGSQTKSSATIDGQWLTPARAVAYVQEQLGKGAKQITYATVDPMVGPSLQQMTMEVLGEESIEVFGKVVPATKVQISTSFAPGIKSVGYVDARGLPLRATIDMGGLSLTILAADKALATSRHKAPELLATTLVKPDRLIENPRQLTKATYILRRTDGQKLELPDTDGAQRVQMLDDGSVQVSVELGDVGGAVAGGEEVKLEHSSLIDGRDPRVVELLKKATIGVGDGPMDRAKAMRRYVYDFIDKKNLGVGFASAGEVAQTRQGDCTEHAVVLAAMLRADGVPSRVISGLVYVDEAIGAKETFGYHMWTQAWLGGRWVDLDATLGEVDFDAAHIALSAGTMPDGKWTNDLVALAPVLGNLAIQVQP